MFCVPLTFDEAGGIFLQKGKEINMVTIPAIDMVATGKNIAKLRQDAGLSYRCFRCSYG
ncbi:hypothetical protein [Butyrivibrio sp. WCD2001]|uniref:hypothetical protein n=1 Tax=Butyrivibrio sp. WCD2001 TaxID=1280681 RepID=UPI00040E8488|nr:hypothetical protein [Butyrivibrio sp. WCD2001]